MTPDRQRSILLLVDSAVSSGVKRVSPKIQSWDIHKDIFFPDTSQNWQRPGALGEFDLWWLVKMFKDPTKLSWREKVLVAIAAEFVWGTPVPEWTTEIRRKIIKFKQQGLALSDLEELLYNIVLIDTDMF